MILNDDVNDWWISYIAYLLSSNVNLQRLHFFSVKGSNTLVKAEENCRNLLDPELLFFCLG